MTLWRFRALLALGLIAAAPGLSAVPALAGKHPNAKIILHAVPYNNRATCAGGRIDSPDKVVTKADLFPARYSVYAIVVDGTPGVGISAVKFGIAFNDTVKRGVDILDWQECSLFNFPSPEWPNESASGNLLSWNQINDCDSTGIRVAGYFYVTAYSPDRLMLIPRPADNEAGVVSCGVTASSRKEEVEDVIPVENLGYVDFGGGLGYNPWDPRQNLNRLKKGPGFREKAPDGPPAGGKH